jgi:hypothetical protein
LYGAASSGYGAYGGGYYDDYSSNNYSDYWGGGTGATSGMFRGTVDVEGNRQILLQLTIRIRRQRKLAVPRVLDIRDVVVVVVPRIVINSNSISNTEQQGFGRQE